MNITVENDRRERLSVKEFVVVCPSCQRKTRTGYTLWDIELLEENDAISELIKCGHCGHSFTYPATTR